MRDITFFLILVTLVPISLRSVHVGVMLWIWTALIAPNEMLFGFMVSVPFGKITAIATILIVIFSKDAKRFYFDGLIGLMLAFVVTGTISALDAAGDYPDNWIIHDKFIKEMVLAYIITITMSTRHRIHMTIMAICLALGFVVADEGLQFIVTAGTHQPEAKASLGDNNHMAVAILMTAPLFVYLAKYAAARYAQLAFYCMVFLSVMATMATNSRGGFVGLIILAAFFFAFSKRKLPVLAILGLAAGLFYFAAPAKYTNRVDTLNEAETDGSFIQRVVAWKVSTLIALGRPAFGGGFHAVQQPAIWTTYKVNFDSLSFIDTPPVTVTPRAAHSIYFEVLGDLGFIGFSVFIAIIVTSLAKLQAIKRQARKIPSLQWAADLAAMIQISFIVYCVAGAAVSLAYFEFLYMLVAVVSVTHQLVRSEVREMTRVTEREALQQRMGIRAAASAAMSPEQQMAIRLLR